MAFLYKSDSIIEFCDDRMLGLSTRKLLVGFLLFCKERYFFMWGFDLCITRIILVTSSYLQFSLHETLLVSSES